MAINSSWVLIILHTMSDYPKMQYYYANLFGINYVLHTYMIYFILFIDLMMFGYLHIGFISLQCCFMVGLLPATHQGNVLTKTLCHNYNIIVQYHKY